MKLLFDQNLSRDLVARLAKLLPGSAHVTDIGLERSADQDVWQHAQTNGFAIVSKDSDFNQMAFLHGAPPKRLGNCTTEEVEQLLRDRATDVVAFGAGDQAAVLVLEE